MNGKPAADVAIAVVYVYICMCTYWFYVTVKVVWVMCLYAATDSLSLTYRCILQQ